MCLLWEKMNNPLLGWFTSIYSWIHRTLSIKVPLEIVQFQPQQSRVRVRRFPVEFWFNVKIPQSISQGSWCSAWPLRKCCLLYLNAISCASVGASSPCTGCHPAELGCSSPSPGICISLSWTSGDSCWLLSPERKIPSTGWKPNY